VNRARFTEGGWNGRCIEFKPYDMGMHVSRDMDTEVSEAGDVWPGMTASWGSAQGIGTSEGV